ncbi:MAG: T9SS type A sorting domain-containing protein, partial [Candidatus Cloacimonetes bacterium]|nr:T9SS type A sorting domain-containing protein [Candidatus Cloacimonadota bacterium]
NTAEVIFSYLVPGASRLGHLTCDEDGIYYASDWSVDKIYKINPFTSEVDTLVSSGLTNPVGIMFDPNYSRLILCCLEDNSPVRAVDVQTGEVSEIAFPNIGSLDAITRDTDGNFYISSWSEGAIYKFDQDFLNTPEIISTGHNGPSGLEFFPETNILGVTNYNSNSISLIYLVVKSTEMKIIYNKLNLINYPNPFNPTTTINYTLKEDTKVILEIYNIKGQKVRTLVDKHLEASNHMVVWNGRNDSGKSVSSGIYFYKMKSGNYSSTKKMILLK